MNPKPAEGGLSKIQELSGYWESIACLLRQLINNRVFGDEDVAKTVEQIREHFNALNGRIVNKTDNLMHFSEICTKLVPKLIAQLAHNNFGERLAKMKEVFAQHITTIKASVDIGNQTRSTAEHFFFALVYAVEQFSSGTLDDDAFREEVSNLGLAIGAMNFVVCYDLKNVKTTNGVDLRVNVMREDYEKLKAIEEEMHDVIRVRFMVLELRKKLEVMAISFMNDVVTLSATDYDAKYVQAVWYFRLARALLNPNDQFNKYLAAKVEANKKTLIPERPPGFEG